VIAVKRADHSINDALSVFAGHPQWLRCAGSAVGNRRMRSTIAGCGMLVRASFDISRPRYVSPRIFSDLRERQTPVSRKPVGRLMQKHGNVQCPQFCSLMDSFGNPTT
jgi:hypothetical protein